MTALPVYSEGNKNNETSARKYCTRVPVLGHNVGTSQGYKGSFRVVLPYWESSVIASGLHVPLSLSTQLLPLQSAVTVGSGIAGSALPDR